MALTSVSSCGPLTLPRLLVIFALVCVLYLSHDAWIPPSPHHALTSESYGHRLDVGNVTSPISRPAFEDECLSMPGAEKIMIVLKTGATEIYDKLPTQLVTLFRCTPHYLIFSDLAQTFADYPIYDALDTVGSEYKDHHGDFELYRKLQTYHREGQNPSKLKGDEGWFLDKWKFFPMLHESYRMAPPEVEWFVYMEADTSVSWPNLLQLLQSLKPNSPVYMGAQNILGDSNFAHGGSGFVVSRSAAKKMEDRRQKEGADAYDRRWESVISSSCCGDEVIARALLEVGVPLLPSWPRIQGETLSTLDWTEKHWCTPAVTWHHVTPAQVDVMWQFQKQWVQDRGWSATYLYKDVFDAFVSRHMSVNHTSWNNLSQDAKYIKPDEYASDEEIIEFSRLADFQKRSVESFDDCAQACRTIEICKQWMWEPDRCYLGREVRLGDNDEREEHHWTSGWMHDRIDEMRKRLEPCSVRWTD